MLLDAFTNHYRKSTRSYGDSGGSKVDMVLIDVMQLFPTYEAQ